MRFVRHAAVLAVFVFSLVAAAGANAAANPGTGCNILAPDNSVLAAGTGTAVVSAAGGLVSCQGQLPTGTPAPSSATSYAVGTCRVVVTPSGRANEICRSP